MKPGGELRTRRGKGKRGLFCGVREVDPEGGVLVEAVYQVDMLLAAVWRDRVEAPRNWVVVELE